MMEKIHFSIDINAPVEKVWNIMLNDDTYREWTTAFHEGSYYQGSWEKGSKILFIGPDPETGEQAGMVARIAENKLHEFISIEHVGIFIKGKEDTTSEEAKKWAPAFENYTFSEKDGVTTLQVDMDILSEHKDMFLSMWPKGLQKIKELSEK